MTKFEKETLFKLLFIYKRDIEKNGYSYMQERHERQEAELLDALDTVINLIGLSD